MLGGFCCPSRNTGEGVTIGGKAKWITHGAIGKPTTAYIRWLCRRKRRKFPIVYLNAEDLGVIRLKWSESFMEGRTYDDVQISIINCAKGQNVHLLRE